MDNLRLVNLKELKDSESDSADKRCREILEEFATDDDILEGVAIVAITSEGETVTSYTGRNGFMMLGAIEFMAHKVKSDLDD